MELLVIWNDQNMVHSEWSILVKKLTENKTKYNTNWDYFNLPLKTQRSFLNILLQGNNKKLDDHYMGSYNTGNIVISSMTINSLKLKKQNLTT